MGEGARELENGNYPLHLGPDEYLDVRYIHDECGTSIVVDTKNPWANLHNVPGTGATIPTANQSHSVRPDLSIDDKIVKFLASNLSVAISASIIWGITHDVLLTATAGLTQAVFGLVTHLDPHLPAGQKRTNLDVLAASLAFSFAGNDGPLLPLSIVTTVKIAECLLYFSKTIKTMGEAFSMAAIPLLLLGSVAGIIPSQKTLATVPPLHIPATAPYTPPTIQPTCYPIGPGGNLVFPTGKTPDSPLYFDQKTLIWCSK